MTNPKPNVPPKKRLAKLLQTGSTIAEVKEFRAHCRDVYQLGGVFGLDYWIDARRDLGLLQTKPLLKAANELQYAIQKMIIAAIETNSKPKPVGMSWDEKMALLIQREEHRRNNIPRVGCYVTRRPPTQSERMAAAYDRLKQQRDVP